MQVNMKHTLMAAALLAVGIWLGRRSAAKPSEVGQASAASGTGYFYVPTGAQ